jgi:GntR family transcriptional regulator
MSDADGFHRDQGEWEMRAALPLYLQIESALRQRIRSGGYPAGGRFPTDEKLCAEFKVSRATVRLALDALHRDGLIVRHPGRGSFVNELRDRVQTLRFEGSVERVIAHGDMPGTEHFLVERVVGPPTPLEASELKLEDGRLVLRVTGFRRRGDERLGHVVIALPESIGALLDVHEGHAYLSIAGMLVERLGLKVCEMRQVISAALANPGIAAALDIPVGAPILTIRRTHYGVGGSPLELAITSYPADRYQYEAAITGMA